MSGITKSMLRPVAPDVLFKTDVIFHKPQPNLECSVTKKLLQGLDKSLSYVVLLENP